MRSGPPATPKPRPHERPCGALIAPAAIRAAMPLRSEPEDAAVGDVFGTFAVVVAVMRTRSSADAEFLGHHLRDLDVEPLPHLGAAMVQVHRAVLIDMHQRAGLVEVDEREADAELHRGERKAALHDRRRGVERRDLLRAARDNRWCAPASHERRAAYRFSSTSMPNGVRFPPAR